MIAPLRRRHRRLVSVLALLVPLGLLAALSGRAPDPELPLPAALRGPDAPARAPDARAEYASAVGPIAADVWFGTDAALRLRPAEDPRQPDLLVLWTRAADDAARLPADATLLGRLAGTAPMTCPLPAAAAAGGGTLLLYVLPRQEVLARLPLPARDAP